MECINAIIVDDEWLMRRELGLMLSNIDGLEIIGEAGSVSEAATMLETISPDVIFWMWKCPES